MDEARSLREVPGETAESLGISKGELQQIEYGYENGHVSPYRRGKEYNQLGVDMRKEFVFPENQSKVEK